ncbi:MAG: glycoside hydrolase family 130 protein [Victivallaceae bacterium]|nr:glycoside hydrolase family 130 protein [Victivallaceae bacterium]
MIFKRSEKNPLIQPADVKPSAVGFQVVGAFNPGAVAFKDEIILLLRVAENCIHEKGKVRVPVYTFQEGIGVPEVMEFEENDPDIVLKDTRGVVYKGKDYLSSLSHIRLARSRNGVDFIVDDSPFIFPCSSDEEYGIEDARVTFIDGRYYINYTIVSGDGWSTALSVTDDFKSHERLGVIFHPQNKDVSIFPEKVNGKYIALHRPNNDGFGKPSIWYSESPDLLHWGNHKCIVRPRPGVYESMKVGGGSAPLKTDKGWLCIYHGKGDNSKYSLFPLLLDLEEPWRVIKRPEKPVFEPELPYETGGFFPNVVFTNGMVEKDGNIYMYYGSADETSCLAVASVNDLMSTFP